MKKGWWRGGWGHQVSRVRSAPRTPNGKSVKQRRWVSAPHVDPPAALPPVGGRCLGRRWTSQGSSPSRRSPPGWTLSNARTSKTLIITNKNIRKKVILVCLSLGKPSKKIGPKSGICPNEGGGDLTHSQFFSNQNHNHSKGWFCWDFFINFVSFLGIPTFGWGVEGWWGSSRLGQNPNFGLPFHY